MLRIQCGILDTIISSQPHDVNIRDLFMTQIVRKASGAQMCVIKKRAITIYFFVHSLMYHFMHRLSTQQGMKFSAFGVLNTVIWPQNLSHPVHFEDFSRLVSVMTGSKTHMVTRMPVLCRHNKVKM